HRRGAEFAEFGVFADQKTLLLRALSASAVRYPSPYLTHGHTFVIVHRQRDREDRSSAHFALDSDLPAQKIHELLNNSQPQAGASIFFDARRIHSVKFLEDLIQVLFLDANSSVRHC